MGIHTSFVMAVLNRSRLLKNTLEGYRRHSPYPGVELVISDYGSTDDLLGVLNDAKGIFERIRCLILDRSKSVIPINPKFNNPAVALNVAIRAARANFLIFSPPECYPLADNIRHVRIIMNNGARKAALLGKAMGMPEEASELMEKDGWMPENENQVFQMIQRRKLLVWSSKEKGVLRPIPFFMAFRKEDHQRINGFDEEYVRGYGGEDRDYVLRLKLAGAEPMWDDRCGVLHQWHPIIPSGPHGTDPRRPNWRRDGFRANLTHEPGSLKLVAKEVSF